MHPSTILALVFTFALFAGLTWIGLAVKQAPEGYEDLEGFHLGRPALTPPLAVIIDHKVDRHQAAA